MKSNINVDTMSEKTVNFPGIKTIAIIELRSY